MKTVQVNVSVEEGKKEMEMRHIFKMIVKVMAVVVVTAIATPALFGFTAVFSNSLEAGDVAGLLALCVGLLIIDYITLKGICRARGVTERHNGGARCGNP